MKKMRMHWSLLVALLSVGTMSAAATSPLNITPNQMVTATVSIGHRAAIAVTGGTPPYQWRLASGSLPAGLSFDDVSGTIVGVPEVDESTSLVVSVSDSAGHTASALIGLSVI